MDREDWIGRQVPRSVAICPKCGANLVIEEIDEWYADGDECGLATENGLKFTCIVEPEMDDPDPYALDEWFSWHFDMPYVDWLPLQSVVYKWYLLEAKKVGE